MILICVKFIVYSQLSSRKQTFPGSPEGSLNALLADTLMNETVTKCYCGIDDHTGAVHRRNLPRVKVNMDIEVSESLSKAFGVPVVLDSELRDGSLREAAGNLGIFCSGL